MRRYNIVSGILPILFIIDFALAAPVLVQEKRQAHVDVVHIPRDTAIVLGKRADGELEKLAEEFFKTSGKSVESSDAHVSSSAAPPGPNHESTNVEQAPAPNPAPSTANLNPSMEPPGPSIEPESPAPSDSQSYRWLFETQGDKEVHKPLPTQTSSEHDLELTLALPGLGHGSTKVVQGPARNPASLTADPNPLVESPGSSSATLSDSPKYKWSFELGRYGSHRPPQSNPKKRPWTDMSPYQNWDWATLLNRPWPLKESGQTSKYQHVQQPDPVPSTAFNSDLNRFPDSPVSVVHPPSTFTGLPTRPEHNVVNPPFMTTGLPTELKHDVLNPPFTITGLPKEPKHDVVHPPFTITGLPAELKYDPVHPPFTVTWSPTKPEHDVVHPPFAITWSSKEPEVPPPFTITGLPKLMEYEVVNRPPSSPDPEFHLDHPSLTTDSQPVDLLAAIYAAKGKGMESRRIFGTARDVGNAAQRELQPDGRSLDPAD